MNAPLPLSLMSLLLLGAVGAPAAEPPVAFRGARILTAAGKTFDPGTLVVEGGKIVRVGPQDRVRLEDGTRVIDARGKVIIPGLVDTHSHLGVSTRPHVPANSDGNERTGPVQSVVRALDSLNPFDPGIRMANAGGVTTANIMPGSANVIGGQTIYVKLRGNTPQQMWIASREVLGGLKMANGENPKRSYGPRGQAPGTRMKVAALQRSQFVKAREYQRKWDAYRNKLAAGEEAEPPPVDLALEPLVEVLERKRTVHFHTHRADDILTTLRLKEEFGFELLIQHGTESYKVLDQIAAAHVPVSMTIVDSPGGKAEVVDFIEGCGAEMERAGIKVLINTDDPVTDSRFFLRTAAIAVRGGLSEETALRAITLYGAQAMHLDHRLGSLEEGKDADFVVLSGPPFSVYTRVLETYIDGVRVFNLADERERLYQTGGFNVARRERVPADAPLIKPPAPVAAPAVPPGRKVDADGDLVVLAGRLHTVEDGTIENGAVLVRDGKIVFAGPRNKLKIPRGARVLAAAAVTPGLIDAYSVVPLAGQYNIPADQDQDELSGPNQADLRVQDAFNPGEPLLAFLLQQGITVIHACPGRANVIGGQSGVFRTHGDSAESMTVRFPQAVVFSLGAAPKETYEGKQPGTRMGTAALIRTALSEAANYARARGRDEDKRPELDLKHETLGQVLSRKLPAMFTAQRADDLLTALRLSREFKLRPLLAMAAEGYLVADEIAASGTDVIVHPTMQRVGDMETYNTFLGNAAALKRAGIRVAICSGFESYVPKTRVVRHEAAIGMVYGLGFEGALRTVTLDAARILDIDDRFGSLKRGKVADLVLYDGDPFEHATHVTQVVVGGRVAYDRSTRQPVPLGQRWALPSVEIPCCLSW